MDSILRIDLPPIILTEDHTHHGNNDDSHDHSINATTSPDHNHVTDNKLRAAVISNIEEYFNSEDITFENVDFTGHGICDNCKCEFVNDDATVKTCFKTTNDAGEILNDGVTMPCTNITGKSCLVCKNCGQTTTSSPVTSGTTVSGVPGGTTISGVPGGTTVSGVPGGITTLSPADYSNVEEPSNFVMDLLNSLELDDIMTLLVLLLNIDLDRDGTPDIFQLLKGIKDYIFNKQEYNINNDYELMRRLRNYKGRQLSPYGQRRLSQSNHALFTQIAGYGNVKGSGSGSGSGRGRGSGSGSGSGSETSFNGDFVPGYAYTNPQFWESEKRPPPVCIKDKYSIKSPAMVLGDGIAMNALNIQKNLLPSFTYTEKSARQQEIDAFNEHRQYSCNEYCSDNCNNEICHALECDKCK